MLEKERAAPGRWRPSSTGLSEERRLPLFLFLCTDPRTPDTKTTIPSRRLYV